MNIKPIKTKTDYHTALKKIESLMSSKANTSSGEQLELLVTLVEAYERKHYPLDLPDPIEAVLFQMDRKALTPKDLTPMIGRLSRVYEVLNRKRPLTLRMIRSLHDGLDIPAESLIKEPCFPTTKRSCRHRAWVRDC